MIQCVDFLMDFILSGNGFNYQLMVPYKAEFTFFQNF